MQGNLFSSGSYGSLKSIKYLMIVLISTSLLSPIITFFLNHYFQLPGPQDWLPLSLPYLKKDYFFEFITYPLVHLEGVEISLSSLVSLFLRIGLLWFASSEVANEFGEKRFFWLFFSTTLFTGLTTASILFLLGSPTALFGTTPLLFALLIVWIMNMQEEELISHPLVRVKAKTVGYIILGATLLINLSYGHFLLLVANLLATLYGLAFGRLILKLPFPFPLPKRKRKKKREKERPHADIIDITSISENPDDLFMDEMLDKIARVGREGLTTQEKARMDAIVRRRRHSSEERE
jgi:hypothetical protein